MLNIPGNVVTGLENYDLSGSTTGAYRERAGKFLARVLDGKFLRARKSAATPVLELKEKNGRSSVKMGESVVFSVTATADGDPWNGGKCTLVIYDSFGKRLLEKPCDFTKNNQVEISFRPEKPAILVARLLDLQSPEGKKLQARAANMLGVAYAPEQLAPMRPAPADFAEFCQKAREKTFF